MSAWVVARQGPGKYHAHILRGINSRRSVTTNLLDPCCLAAAKALPAACRRQHQLLHPTAWSWSRASRGGSPGQASPRRQTEASFTARSSREAFRAVLFLNPPYLSVLTERAAAEVRSESSFTVAEHPRTLMLGGLHHLPSYNAVTVSPDAGHL
ncbi:MAG: DUF6094 domain-containing protein [Acutalibacteraceae bacterium]